jgi:TetR/AcrR family transcriptional repressor of lmrAB and yxaGH operons
VLELADAPRGSVYHHFPGGKDELVAEAIARAGVRSIDTLDGLDGQSPAVVAERFFASWRELLTRSDYRAGCSVAAVTIATDSAELRERAGSVLESWRARLADLLTQGGLSPAAADAQAVALIAASEGAVVMCRAAASIEPLDIVAKATLDQLKALTQSMEARDSGSAESPNAPPPKLPGESS